MSGAPGVHADAFSSGNSPRSLIGMFFQLIRAAVTVVGMDWIVTGASRGIGHALVRHLAAEAATGDRLFVLARDVARLDALVEQVRGPAVVRVRPVDLSRVDEARRAGERLAAEVSPAATLVHNAGIWPTRRVIVDGLEEAFVTNCLGPLALQAPLLEARRLARVLVVSAGLLVKGRFDAERTPTGKDFSIFRTYATTKLAGAAAMRDEARRWPDVDVAIVHPGVVNTDLGAVRGPLGWWMARVKRRWEAPEVCAARLGRILARPRWQRAPGEAPWFFEETEAAWPSEVDRDRAAVAASVARYLTSPIEPRSATTSHLDERM